MQQIWNTSLLSYLDSSNEYLALEVGWRSKPTQHNSGVGGSVLACITDMDTKTNDHFSNIEKWDGMEKYLYISSK